MSCLSYPKRSCRPLRRSQFLLHNPIPNTFRHLYVHEASGAGDKSRFVNWNWKVDDFFLSFYQNVTKKTSLSALSGPSETNGRKARPHRTSRAICTWNCASSDHQTTCFLLGVLLHYACRCFWCYGGAPAGGGPSTWQEIDAAAGVAAVEDTIGRQYCLGHYDSRNTRVGDENPSTLMVGADRCCCCWHCVRIGIPKAVVLLWNVSPDGLFGPVGHHLVVVWKRKRKKKPSDDFEPKEKTFVQRHCY